jgi:hypothetical protein
MQTRDSRKFCADNDAGPAQPAAARESSIRLAQGATANGQDVSYRALIPCRLWEASLQVKNTTSASGVALPECTAFEGM